MMKSSLGIQAGVGLIEVLVTVLLVGTSSLGIAALQARSLQYNHGAYTRTQANLIAYELLDSVRMKHTPDGPITKIPSNIEVTNYLKSKIPSATEGEFSCDVRLCTVRIKWSDVAGTDSDQKTSTYEYSSSL